MIAPELPFEIRFIEITKPEEVIELNGYRITAFRVNHNVICYGYTLEILRQGKFSPERAKEQEIPLKFWNPLQKGQSYRGKWSCIYSGYGSWTGSKGDQTYVYHRYQTNGIHSPQCQRVKIFFICEGMYGEDDKADKAKGYKQYDFPRSGGAGAGCPG